MDVFFYGLFMDERLLRKQGLNPANPRYATLPNYRLRIAERANLVADTGATCSGLVIDLPSDEVLSLYGAPTVWDYKPESVTVDLEGGEQLQVVCYLLPEEKTAEGSNMDYAKKLHQLATDLRFPDEYLEAILLSTDSTLRLGGE